MLSCVVWAVSASFGRREKGYHRDSELIVEGVPTKKERSRDFQVPPPSKKLLAAHMDPDMEVAKAKILAIINMQKTKSNTGSKGSLVTETKVPEKEKGLEEASATGGGQAN